MINARLLIYGNTTLVHYARDTFEENCAHCQPPWKMKVCQEERKIHTLFQAEMTNEQGRERVVNTFLLERKR